MTSGPVLSAGPLSRARAIAEELLYPAAVAIDRSPVLPRRYLDELAAAGLYGLFGPSDHGGLDAGPQEGAAVVEALGGASLTTAFVWIQHLGVVRMLAAVGGVLRARHLSDLCSGRTRAGIAYAALRRPGPPSAVAERSPDGDGWLLSGYAPWVTGWGLIDLVLAGARHEDDVVWVLLDASASPTCEVVPSDLAALQASATVELRWGSHHVPASRVVAVEPFSEWVVRDALGLHLNGHLAVGVAARCCSLLGPSPLDPEVDALRDGLDGRADPDTTARLMREATFLLVFAQTATIRSAQLGLLESAWTSP